MELIWSFLLGERERADLAACCCLQSGDWIDAFSTFTHLVAPSFQQKAEFWFKRACGLMKASRKYKEGWHYREEKTQNLSAQSCTYKSKFETQKEINLKKLANNIKIKRSISPIKLSFHWHHDSNGPIWKWQCEYIYRLLRNRERLPFIKRNKRSWDKEMIWGCWDGSLG